MTDLAAPVAVGHVIDRLGVGGAEGLVRDLVASFDRRFAPCVLTVSGAGPIADQIRALGVPVLPHRRASKLGLLTIVQLARAFRARRLRIVHTHLFGGLLWGGLAARLAGVPIHVHTEHSTNAGERARHRLARRVLNRLPTRTIAISAAVKEHLVAELGVDPSTVDVVYNGIPLERFSNPGVVPTRGPDSPFTVGAVARFAPAKGHTDLVRAFALVRQAIPSARLVLIGDGPLVSEARALIDQFTLTPSVDLLGARQDVPALLATFDVAVLPSRWEGLGLTAIEAMAVGLPVVATRVGGIPEVVADGETGFLVPAADPAALAERLIWLYHNPAVGAALGRAGRARARAHFSLEAMTRGYERVYLHALAARPASDGVLARPEV